MAIWIFGMLAPRAAALWFERLILTPSLYPGLRDGEDPAPDGTHTRLPYGNGWLSVWSWGDGPVVLLMHGWGGRAVHLQEFVDPLLAEGFRVVAFDAPAHGRSDGVRTNLIECTGAVLQVAGSVGSIHGIIAHSFGSPTAAMAVRHGLKVNKMVFIGAPQSIGKLTHGIARIIGLPAKVPQRTQERIESRLGISMEDLETDRVLASADVPLLVFHDEEDRDVPWEDAQAIVRAVKEANLVTTTGLGHRRIIQDAEVVQQAVDFLRVPANQRDVVSVETV
jgi:pimeloyl-ACP methyl ester carboxylesterase